ncbi:MAG: amidase [Deltaproteobacteria bacterium]|jgi:amidase|nr:amidase [Deltaproteobacteria bacterium]MBW2499799.1 amidase [Deltaproteobacteria bacterium]
MSIRSILPADAHDLAAQVRAGECSAREQVEAAIARVEKLDPEINAVVHPRFEAALREAEEVDPARQLFAGVPILIKDAGCPIAGEPHHQGMRALREADLRESESAWLVDRLRAAGFVIIGRTNVPEMTSLPTTEPLAYGATRNPWSLEHSAGGSSGGSAAAVAAGMVPIAHASDGGGSTRMPASCCGLVGLKPTRGRLTRGPQEGVAWGGLAIDGFVTRSVRDTAAVLDAAMGPGPGDPEHAPALPRSLVAALAERPNGLRIGVRTSGFVGSDATHPEVAHAVEGTAAALEALGHRVGQGGPAVLDDEAIPEAQGAVVATAQAVLLDQLGRRIGREIDPGELEPVNARTVEAARGLGAVDYATAMTELQAYARRVAAWWEEHDLLLMPTITDLTPRLGEVRGDASLDALAALRQRFGWLTPPWNITGQPAISLPVAWSGGGLPIGVQLVAATGREDLLVSVAARLEEVYEWVERKPPRGVFA